MEAPHASVKSEVIEGIALVTFSAPNRNVATIDTWATLTDTIGRHADDAAVRALVLTGAGHHAFVADPDAADPVTQAEYEATASRAQAALVGFAKPVLARVRGDCIGNGLLLAARADLVIAAEDSTFALPGARWGMAYAPEAVAWLTTLVGPQHAKRLLFAGSRMGAREALRIGLVTLVVDDADLSDIVVDLAQSIANNGPLAVAAAKRMVGQPGDPALDTLPASCLNSADYATGVAAFRRGKQAVFGGL